MGVPFGPPSVLQRMMEWADHVQVKSLWKFLMIKAEEVPQLMTGRFMIRQFLKI